MNTLAWNIAIGRNRAGIHWRGDAAEGLTLGETVASSLPTDPRQTYNEAFGGYTFTTFRFGGDDLTRALAVAGFEC